MHSIKLKFVMHITGQRFIYFVDFGKFRINNFFTCIQKNHYTLQPIESNYKNYVSVQKKLSIKLKYHMYAVDHSSLYYIKFVVSRRHSFLQDTRNVIHYGQ